MIKKFIISLVIFLILAGALGFYAILKYRENLRAARQTAKAPQISVTFLEGWTNQDIADYLDKTGVVKSEDFLKTAKTFDTSNYDLLASKPKAVSLEGYIFPDTYFIPQNLASSTEISNIILKKALANFTDKFTSQMQAQADSRGMSVFQIVTLASIIEKETGRTAITSAQKISLDNERAIVSGIFYNRLNSGIPLQSDATVNFVTKKNIAAPNLADTEIDSPYNTYKYKGLPPGPISNPSLSSIEAALYPRKTDYLYFLHDQTTGQVYYAKTYEEHLKNKNRYLK